MSSDETLRTSRSLFKKLLALQASAVDMALSEETFGVLCDLYDGLILQGIPPKKLSKPFEEQLKKLLRPVDVHKLQAGMRKPTAFISYSFGDDAFKEFIERQFVEDFLEGVLHVSCYYARRDLKRSAPPGVQIVNRDGLISRSDFVIAFCTRDVRATKGGIVTYYPAANVVGEIHSAKTAGLKTLVFRERGSVIPTNLATSITWVDFDKADPHKVILETTRYLSAEYALHWIDLARLRQ
jgi:hypothetical protein